LSNRRYPPPGWVHRVVLLGFAACIIAATVLRASHPPADLPRVELSEQYRPVSAAVGLSRELPRGGVLATYVYALAYAAHYRITAIPAPHMPPVTWASGFLKDPIGFSGPARLIAVEAGVLAVCLLFMLLSRLIDHWAAVAGAFLLAVHPSAVALSHSLDSSALCLCFLLCGLLVLMPAATRRLRLVEFAAGGLALGFATETIPAAWLLAPTLVAWHLHHAPEDRRRHIALGATIGSIAFITAAMTVLPGWYAARGEALVATALHGAILLGVAAAGVSAVRAMRARVSRGTYSSAVLGSALVACIVLVAWPGASRAARVTDPGAAASFWIADTLPDGATVAVHASLRDRVNIPRDPRSWCRELRAPGGLCRHSLAWAVASVQASQALGEPTWDVTWFDGDQPVSSGVQDVTGDHVLSDFVVVPESLEPEPSDGLWLAARFHAREESGEGISIWGVLPASAPRSSSHVDWSIKDAPRTATGPAPDAVRRCRS